MFILEGVLAASMTARRRLTMSTLLKDWAANCARACLGSLKTNCGPNVTDPVAVGRTVLENASFAQLLDWNLCL
jgi:hypothetical protein